MPRRGNFAISDGKVTLHQQQLELGAYPHAKVVCYISVSISATITTCFGENTNGVSLFYPGLDRQNKVITARHISKCTEFGTISELPLNRKETGNTLETRGLTYSYTFYTIPKRSTYGRFASAKNALISCKGTKDFPESQRICVLLASFMLWQTDSG